MATKNTTAPRLEVKGIRKTFGQNAVLKGINLSVDAGEVVALIGGNGAGKSTLMKIIMGIYSCDEGDILIDGQEANPKKHNIAYVFQEPTCLPWRTVRENVAYGMEVKGVPKAEREQRASDIMDLVGLSSCADLYPNQVSASMMQRIAVSRAFAVNPDLLLMDEPYGQLDVKLRFYLEDELVNLWQKLNSTILFVTHNIEEAVYVAERILVLTNKPTKVKAEIQVDLPRPRKLIDPRFVELRRQVTELIRWW